MQSGHYEIADVDEGLNLIDGSIYLTSVLDKYSP